MTVTEIFETMDYGPRPRKRRPRRMAWLAGTTAPLRPFHRRRLHRSRARPSRRRNPATGEVLAADHAGTAERRRRRRRRRPHARSRNGRGSAATGGRGILYALARLRAEAVAPLRRARNPRQRQADPREPRHRHSARRAPFLLPRRHGPADAKPSCPAARPLGVCGQIIPWNFPLLMLAWKIAPGARRRQYRGAEAGGIHLADRAALRRDLPRGRPAEGRRQHRHRRRRDRRGARRRRTSTRSPSPARPRSAAASARPPPAAARR